ncbi:TonB-dependent receptor domain-containing protein [Bacteroidota bacterium]
MKKFFTILMLAVLFYSSRAQEISVITGRISDSISGAPLIGTAVISGKTTGTISDGDGKYYIRTGEKIITLHFQYLGYHATSRTVQTGQEDTVFLDINMQRSVTALDEIVVSAGKYEQRLSEVMVSVDIIKPERIANTGTISLETILRQTPGVDILDGQPGIRGGSGYSYGAGSRVLVLMDDLPILSGDAGDVKWDYLPVENIAQIEIIKGASSVLYGSSALNGIFNIRTQYPTDVPSTRISIYSGLYLDPRREELIWWDKQPFYTGIEFSHSRKIRNLDLVVGGNLFKDGGYRENENQKRARLNIGLRYRNQKVAGLSYGINLNSMLIDKSDFLLWRDSRSGAFRQNPQSVSALTGNRFNFDPFLEYSGNSGGQHSLKSRYFHIKNYFADAGDKNSNSDLVYGEYKYHRKFAGRIEATFGVAGTWVNSVAALYGDHSSSNQAVFTQFDGSIVPGLNASLGLRFERYVLDGQVEFSDPVFRAGLNYQVFDHTYLRASFGQGYRFPTTAEKYTATNVGSLKIFPNPALVSETGWSTEIGFKQGLKVSDWSGYIDLAAFWTEYNEMIEFLFDIYQVDSMAAPGLDDYGFMAQNVGNARIAGIELTLYGDGKIGKLPVSLMAGYTNIYPEDLNAPDSAGEEKNYLKYRYRHSLKLDAELRYKRFTLGSAFIYNSRMEKIDEVFTDPLFGNIILPGFPLYWEENNRANAILDVRLLCNITPNLNAGLFVKNLLNKEYLGRPGDIQPPRNITLRLTADF